MFTNAQIQSLNLYEALLKKWSGALNLVAPSTLNAVFERHFEDSATLLPFLPPKGHVVDVGSGAGFPALVLALLAPHLTFTLIESDGRKCEFLKEVKRQLKLNNAHILNQRIEQAAGDFDMISARACASLKQLLMWMVHLKVERAVFLKGKNYESEIAEALTAFTFEHQTHSRNEGVILEIYKVAPIKMGPQA